jgi:hypothetical protein
LAEILSDLGIAHMLSLWPASGAGDATLYVGLFGALTSGTVPARDVVGGATPSGWTEVTGWGYGRQVVSAGQWGATAISGAGLKITAVQVAFATATGTWASANGLFVATKVSSQAGDIPCYFANFDDLTTVVLNSGDQIKVQPGLSILG